VSRLLSDAEARATALLSSHRAALDAVVALLLERETIDGEELSAVVAASATPAAATPAAAAPTPAASTTPAATSGASTTPTVAAASSVATPSP